MRRQVLATDYDGTLARDGFVDTSTVEALERLRKSGRKLVLVTGRELEELLGVFPRIDLFDRVVAENGALLHRPETRAMKMLGQPPPEGFVEELRRRGVGPISVGRVVVATWRPHQETVAEVIRACGLDLQVVLNKRAVMVLPSGVDKATGLAAALAELGLAPRDAVGIGDAENDLSFLALCRYAAVVENALSEVKAHADFVTVSSHGAGVAELIAGLVENDLTEPKWKSRGADSHADRNLDQ